MPPSQVFLSAEPLAVEPEHSVPLSTSIEEDRRLRRMISNRESARRSRMRKQQHLEELTAEMNRLKSVNRDLSNRLWTVNQHTHLFRRDSFRLRSDSTALRRRLEEIRRILLFLQLQRLAQPAPDALCTGFFSGEHNFSSVIV
ncbi:Light-inducible protein CPRF2 [Platanthera guangdongensis]|uniref:Light-inducible protein CPRF2 n=1 Tax=Platanthera guangdongensis TaxID=2320717 RepID=A0ABR2MEX1_9ASPA